ncbi:NmrA family NAD(P)-binding protein [Kaistia terrae]|uniref:NmrA family NAD(P)-binding protein n=1 Tax=Kaistia terrae TaxID=537017 RepID=A0ABW0Q0A5_9HYPH|nr:NmrA family NAD(P)-binding protein [Kaistia terrae]MCX5581661.1 NmrA family NAD(P)-binding protein [Kaistia terrae]
MSYIIHGATGAQGGPLYARLLASGKNALAAVRDPAKVAGKPAIAVDNDSVDSLVAAYRDADGVFIHLPQTSEPTRVQQAKNIVQAIKITKPKRVVVSTSGTIIDQPGTVLQAPEDNSVAILARGVAESGVSHAIVAPRLYLENLLLPMVFEPAEAEGVLRYPVAPDFLVSWSSHLDVAEVAEKLLTDHSVTGVVGVGHRPGLRGADLAAGFSEQFGRTVTFEALTPDAFGKLIEPMLGPATVGVVGLYQALSGAADNVIADDTSAQHLLGLEPRSVRQWLAEMLG